nr:hypothetical protein [Lachnospiraceae bacterium]
MGERNGRKNYIQQSGIRGVSMWIVFLLFAVKVVYMSYKNGMQGMTYYALADVLYILLCILLGVAVIPVMKKMIFFQMNKGSYRNGFKVYKTISVLIHVLAISLCVAIFLFSEWLSRAILGTVLCSLSLKLVALALLFAVSGFCIKGYMEGIGNPVPGMYADVLAHLTGLIVTVLFQPVFADYGRRVAAVMGQDSYAYAYAACSGILGLCVGGVVGYIFLFLVKTVLGKQMKQRIRQDEMKKTDTSQDILWNFLVGYVKTAFVEHVGVLLMIVLVILYCHTQGRMETGAGMLFAGAALMALPAAIIASQIATPFSRHLTTIMRQADFHHAKERISFSLKLLSYTVFPYVTLCFSLAPLVGNVFFDTETEGFAGLIRIGMGVAVLLALCLLFRQTLSVLTKPYIRNLYAAILGICGILFFLLLGRYKIGGEESVVYAYLLACLVYLAVTGFAVLKKIRIHNRLAGSIVLPFVSAVVAALVSYGIYCLLDSVLPSLLVLVICVIAGYLLHNVVIVILRVFEPHEWNEVPFSELPKSFAKMLGRY